MYNNLPFNTIVEFNLQQCSDVIEIMYWLINNVGADNWEPEHLANTGTVIGLSFRNEEDASAFRLRFGI